MFRSSSSIADVDGQNGPDLLITGQDSNGDRATTLYLQQPDGSFQPSSAGLSSVDDGSSSIADVDGQNGPDLFITGRDSNGDRVATLYLQQLDGSFQPAGAGLTGVGFGSSSSIADVDGRNGPDLLITGRDSNFNRVATLYLQQPDGSFQPAGASLTGVFQGSSSIADVDADGDLDLFLTGSGGFFGEPSARVYVNRTVQPGPNRSPRVAQPVPPQILAADTDLRFRVEFGDPDGDPLALQLTQGPSAGNVSFTDAGNGTGELQYTLGPNQAGQTLQFTVDAADAAAQVASVSVEVQISSVVASRQAGLTGVLYGSSSIADVDGQNGPDLLITGLSNNGSVATLYLQQPDGSFQSANAGLTGVYVGSSSIADVDGQNGPDLLITGAGRATLYLQQPDGSFQPAGAGLSGVGESSSSIADVDRQNGPDLLITGLDSNRDPVATLYLQQPDGSFQSANAGLTGVEFGPSSIADVDGQNGPDLLITGRDSNDDRVATLYLQQPDGSFQPAGAGLPGVSSGSSSIADVDGQNGPDLLITGFSDNGPVATLYLQQPDGSFQPAGAGLTGVLSSSSSIADVDGQNGPDLLITGLDSNRNRVATLYLQQPDGSFQPANAGLPGVEFGSSSIADIDGDGDPELLITGFKRTIANAAFSRPSAVLYDNLLDPADAVAAVEVPNGASTQAFTGTGVTD